jgi:hypothetical protein
MPVVCGVVALAVCTVALFMNWGGLFFGMALAGSSVLFAPIASRRNWIIAVAISLGAALLYSTTQHHSVLGMVGCIGMGPGICLAWKASHEARCIRYFLAAVTLALLALLSSVAVTISAQSSAPVYDLTLARFDQAYLIPCHSAAVHLFTVIPGLEVLAFLIYAGLPAIFAWAVLSDLESNHSFLPFAFEIAIAGIVGYVSYYILPAIGPRQAFGKAFADVLATPLSNGATLHAGRNLPRNCMPSLHLTWVLLVYWRMGDPRRRILAGVFVAFTVLATIGSGEHYVVDLIVAVAFASAIRWAFERQLLKASAATVLTLIWICYFRFGFEAFPPHPAGVWVASAITILFPYFANLVERFNSIGESCKGGTPVAGNLKNAA